MIPILIYLLVPLAGIVIFLLLRWTMLRSGVVRPPVAAFFTLFGAYGGWLVVVLTGVFWEWSGAASLGVASLVLVAPLVMAWQARTILRERRLSGYDRVAIVLMALYVPLCLVTYLLAIAASDI